MDGFVAAAGSHMQTHSFVYVHSCLQTNQYEKRYSDIYIYTLCYIYIHLIIYVDVRLLIYLCGHTHTHTGRHSPTHSEVLIGLQALPQEKAMSGIVRVRG